MKQIIVVKPLSVSKESKQMLKDEGIILIEHDTPSEVRVINNIESFEGDFVINLMSQCLISTGSQNTQIAFAAGLLKHINEKSKPKP